MSHLALFLRFTGKACRQVRHALSGGKGNGQALADQLVPCMLRWRPHCTY